MPRAKAHAQGSRPLDHGRLIVEWLTLFISRGRGARRVIVDCRIVVCDRQLTTLDETTIYEPVKAVIGEFRHVSRSISLDFFRRLRFARFADGKPSSLFVEFDRRVANSH